MTGRFEPLLAPIDAILNAPPGDGGDPRATLADAKAGIESLLRDNADLRRQLAAQLERDPARFVANAAAEAGDNMRAYLELLLGAWKARWDVQPEDAMLQITQSPWRPGSVTATVVSKGGGEPRKDNGDGGGERRAHGLDVGTTTVSEVPRG